MSPDDERSARDRDSSPLNSDPDARAKTPTSSADDDLASLEGQLASSASESIPVEDEAPALDALVRVGGRRARDDEGESRLDLARLIADPKPSQPPTSSEKAGPSAALAAPAPATAPMAARPGSSWALPFVLGLVLGAGLSSGAFFLSGRGDRERDTAAVAAPLPVQAPAPAPEPTTVQPASAPSSVPAAPEPSAAANTNGSAANALPSSSGAGSTHKPARNASGAAAAAASETAPSENAREGVVTAVLPGETAQQPTPVAPAPAEAKPANNSVDQLLDEALSPAARKNELDQQRALELEHAKLPPTPSREGVTQAMTVLLPAIRGCALGQSGTAIAGMVVRADGRVASVEISGAPFAGTASGRCMEGVMRRARFPRFSQPVFRVRFPLAIQ